MYNVPQDNCGSFGLSADSEWVKGLGNSTMSGMLLEVGPVADQSFVPGSIYNGPNTTFYAGVGNYSTLFTGDANNTDTLTNITASG